MSICKTVSLNSNKYTVIMTQHGALFFSVYISTTGANRQLYTPKIQAAIMAELVAQDHAEALAINRQFTRDNFEEKYTSTMQYNEFTVEEVAEAMEINAAHTEGVAQVVEKYAPLTQDGFFAHVWAVRRALIEKAHQEALEINLHIINQQIHADAYNSPENRYLIDLAHADALHDDAIGHQVR